jgi:SAM-dependent methyltransferase
MLARARERSGSRVGLKLGRAEALPFRDGWFERTVMRLVVHHVDRPRALPELARVLAPGGKAVVATFAPGHFERFWVTSVFPEIVELDRRRFPAPETLCSELVAAGFASARVRMLAQRSRLSRADALERIRCRYISSLRLLDDDALAAGLARAERELPEMVESPLEWAVVVASKPEVDAVRASG